MAYRSISVWLEDALIALYKINQLTGSLASAKEYQNNFMVSMAVERGLEIVAEAIKNAIQQEPDLQISDAGKIIGLRNIISHGYYEVDSEKVWQIIKNNLPLLEQQIKNIMNDFDHKLELNEL